MKQMSDSRSVDALWDDVVAGIRAKYLSARIQF
jgi:hypothetical protein